MVPGSLFSMMSGLQRAVHASQLAQPNFRDAVMILGYWRSGTTLLHELLCLDTRYSYPTTHACMNPHHFLLTEPSILARGGPSTTRPMDEMEVRSASPQEDEFALFCLGARSPYEALVMPKILPEALKLSDPKDLSPQEQQRWHDIFLSFLAGVSLRGSGRPMILKSPTHGFRVRTLREVLPDARYVLIIRNPLTSFESVVRMWRKMFENYALGPIPSDDEIREAVLSDRPRFEAKLASGTEGLPNNRFLTIRYESLVQNPLGVIEQLYGRLELFDFEPVQKTLMDEIQRRREYRAKGNLPTDAWQRRIEKEWAPIIEQYSTLR